MHKHAIPTVLWDIAIPIITVAKEGIPQTRSHHTSCSTTEEQIKYMLHIQLLTDLNLEENGTNTKGFKNKKNLEDSLIKLFQSNTRPILILIMQENKQIPE